MRQLLRSEPTPARPGPGPLPEPLLRALDVSIGRRVEGLLAGDYRATLLGEGTELAQVRPYVPGGDDVRRIDWNVTARTNVPHVRVHLAERVLVTWLVLDTSASMVFGTADRRKADVAEGVAIAVGHVATRRGNRLGLVTFGDDSPRTLPPRQGRLGLLGLLSALRDEPVADGAGVTSLGEALRRTGALAQQRSVVIVVSDFRGPQDWRRPLLELAGRHEVVAVEIRDPREQELPECWSALAGRSRDRPPAACGYREREAAGSLRGGGRGGACRACTFACSCRCAACRPHDRRRLASLVCGLPAPGRPPVTFEWPLALIALVVVPVVIALYVLRERRRDDYAARFTTPTLLPNLVAAAPGWRRHLPLALLLVGLTALVVGVARPHASVDVRREEATVIIAIDTSLSMKAQDVRPSRLGAAENAANAFVAELPKRFRVGVIGFSGRAIPRVGADRGPELVVSALRSLRPEKGRRSATRLRSACGSRARSARPTGRIPPTAMLVISDGAQMSGRTSPAAAALKAMALHIPVYSVVLGTPDGVVNVPIAGGYQAQLRVPPSPETLKTLAQVTGGQFFTAPDQKRLSQIHERLGSRLGHRRETREVTDLFAGGSAAFLLVGGALSSLWFRRVP